MDCSVALFDGSINQDAFGTSIVATESAFSRISIDWIVGLLRLAVMVRISVGDCSSIACLPHP
jgi:hypothetical protein